MQYNAFALGKNWRVTVFLKNSKIKIAEFKKSPHKAPKREVDIISQKNQIDAYTAFLMRVFYANIISNISNIFTNTY